MAQPKTEYNEKMLKRCHELVKSGTPPGEAMRKAREECSIGPEKKMAGPPAKPMAMKMTKMDSAAPSGESGGSPF